MLLKLDYGRVRSDDTMERLEDEIDLARRFETMVK